MTLLRQLSGPLVIVGDALIDRDLDGRVERVAPDAPAPVVDQPVTTTRPGGAGLAAALAATDSSDVVLVTAVSDDALGVELRDMLARAGVQVIDIGLDGRTPEKIRVRAGGRTLVRVDRGGGTVRGDTEGAIEAIEAARAVLVSDYGNGVASCEAIRAALARAATVLPLVWDPHPRGLEPVRETYVAAPNRAEAQRAAGMDGATSPARLAAGVLAQWPVRNVVMTVGAQGAVVALEDGSVIEVPATPVQGDSCGAGDRFASRLAVRLAEGLDVPRAASSATGAAAAYVQGATNPAPRARLRADGVELARSVRAGGGTVVVAGGCFDLLHAGHVRMLERARELGDCLIVCINSDESVRRLKGTGRPLIDEHERAELLCSLRCVDATVVFGEDTPEEMLTELRPHVFAKGGDYREDELPESRALRSWGGRVAILPYVEGRSTTKLIEEVFREPVP
jgi:rfaE bifunctional protein nucleotidyltransferase chain/domain/rfaE bifunctional protein kinase chain/domain